MYLCQKLYVFMSKFLCIYVKNCIYLFQKFNFMYLCQKLYVFMSKIWVPFPLILCISFGLKLSVLSDSPPPPLPVGGDGKVLPPTPLGVPHTVTPWASIAPQLSLGASITCHSYSASPQRMFVTIYSHFVFILIYLFQFIHFLWLF